MYKKVILMFLCDALVFGCGISADAINNPVSDDVIVPDYLEVCNGLPYHLMEAHWIGSAYVNGQLYITSGSCCVCSGCNLVMITEGDVTLDPAVAVGKWAYCPAWAGYDPDNITYTIISNPSAYGTCYSSNTLPGFHFVNA